MQKQYKTLYYQIAYVLFSGISLIFFPNVLLKIFGFEQTQEFWIRILGLLVLVLSIYYYKMAKYGNDQTVMATVIGRGLFCVGLIVFVLLGIAPVALLGFALAESVLTFLTWREVSNKKEA